MKRDLTLFPEDETGDSLWSMVLAGETLSKIKEVEFSVLFPHKDNAINFGRLLLENGQKVSFSPYQGDKSHPWEITAYPQMNLTYENVIAYRHLLVSSAEPLEGKYDGWYCISASVSPR